MKKRNSSVAILAAASVLALIAGCGDKASTASSAPSATSEPSKAPATAAAPATKAPAATGLTGELEIQYFVGGYGDKWWKTIISEFEAANPGLKVKHSAGSQINDQMKPRWIKGEPPDVVYIDGAGANETQMVTDDQLLDITDWIKEVKNVDGEKLVDQLFAKPKEFNGKNYTIPLVYGSWGTFYDINFFKENGWKVPTNFDEFMEVGKQIKDSGKGVFPYIHTGKYPYYISGGFLDSAIISANGGDPSILLKIEANEEGIYKSDPVRKALDKIVKMRDAGFIDPASKAINHTDSQMMFLQHKDAFIPNGLWVQNEMGNNVPQGFDFGFIASLGIDPGQKSVVVPYTSTMAIAKKAKNVEAAKAFVQFIFTKQSAIKWAELSGVPMNYKADLESSKAGSMSKAAMKFFLDPGTVTAPTVVPDKDVEEARNNALVALTTGEITPEQYIERMEAAAKKAREKK
jgi:N-acetylglucosamine transport system substrate-binding protein